MTPSEIVEDQVYKIFSLFQSLSDSKRRLQGKGPMLHGDAYEEQKSPIRVQESDLRDYLIRCLSSPTIRLLTTGEILEALVSEVNSGITHNVHEIVQLKFCSINNLSITAIEKIQG